MVSRIYVVGAVLIQSSRTHETISMEQWPSERYKTTTMDCYYPTEPRLSMFYKEKSDNPNVSPLIMTFKTSHFEAIVPHICKEEGLSNEVWNRLPIYAQSMAKKGGVSSYLAEMSLA